MKPNHERTESSDDKKTIDLCDSERDGARCIRRRGHEGKHECMQWRTDQWTTWD